MYELQNVLAIFEQFIAFLIRRGFYYCDLVVYGFIYFLSLLKNPKKIDKKFPESSSFGHIQISNSVVRFFFYECLVFSVLAKCFPIYMYGHCLAQHKFTIMWIFRKILWFSCKANIVFFKSFSIKMFDKNHINHGISTHDSKLYLAQNRFSLKVTIVACTDIIRIPFYNPTTQTYYLQQWP